MILQEVLNADCLQQRVILDKTSFSAGALLLDFSMVKELFPSDSS